MKNLFVYGTLMFEEVWCHLFKGRFVKKAAVLNGYQRLKVTGQYYPGIKKANGSQVNGILIIDLNRHQLRLLDTFEGHYYKRQSVFVSTNTHEQYPCDTYLFKPQYTHLLSKSQWNAEEFRTRFLQSFLRAYSAD